MSGWGFKSLRSTFFSLFFCHMLNGGRFQRDVTGPLSVRFVLFYLPLWMILRDLYYNMDLVSQETIDGLNYSATVYVVFSIAYANTKQMIMLVFPSVASRPLSEHKSSTVLEIQKPKNVYSRPTPRAIYVCIPSKNNKAQFLMVLLPAMEAEQDYNQIVKYGGTCYAKIGMHFAARRVARVIQERLSNS